MEDAVGLTVWVKLKQPPPNDVLYGKVEALVPNSHITLQNVFIPATGMQWDHWTLQASAIENLQVIEASSVPWPRRPPPPNSNQAPPPGFHQSHTPFQQPLGPGLPSIRHAQEPQPQHAPPQQSQAPFAPTTAPAPPPQRQASTFVDPAILSYGNSSPTPQKPAARASDIETPVKSLLARAAANLPSPGSPFIADAGKANNNITQKLRDASRQSLPPGTAPPVPAKPSPVAKSDPAAESGPQDTHQNGQQEGAKKKVRRGQKGKKQVPNPIDIADPPPVMNSEVSRNGNDMNGSVKRGKGWRSTPLLQPSPQTIAPIDKPSATKKKDRRKQKEDDAMGDTTDIADMGDFDFEGELKKFNKKEVFDEIRQGDTTADEDRLVSHNRIARPGTYGGKNLHPTEPVLSPPVQPAVYNSNELDSASDADTELNLANGRSSSKHSVSRTVFPKTKPSRQNSGHVFDTKLHGLTASITADMQRTRSIASLANRTKAFSLAASSPQPDRVPSPQSGGSATAKVKKPTATYPHFAIAPQHSPCPTLLPGALDALEKATVSTFGLTHDAITESAGRCIAEAALQLSAAEGIRRPSRTNTMRGSMTSTTILNDPNEPLTIVILAGNHAIGARALAAARQLLGRNIKIIAAESSFESAETQDPQVKAQTAILRRMARGGANIKRGLWQKASSHIKHLAGPPAVIVDALLAGDTYDSLLSTNASHSAAVQQETREMIDWANRSRAPVLSVGCPSGVSGIDGTSTIVEGEPLSVRAEKVLALGAPMQGLLKAMEVEKLEVSVADIGINIALKSDEAVAFGTAGWSVDLQYVDGLDAVVG